MRPVISAERMQNAEQ